MTNERLLKVIQEAKRSRRTMLDLSKKKIKEIPSEIGELTNFVKSKR